MVRTTSAAPSTSWFRRLVAIGPWAVVRRETQDERERLGRFGLFHRDVVDDDELRGALEVEQELAEALVLALKRDLHHEAAESGLFDAVFVDLTPAIEDADARFPGEIGERGVRQAARRGKVGRQ